MRIPAFILFLLLIPLPGLAQNACDADAAECVIDVNSPETGKPSVTPARLLVKPGQKVKFSVKGNGAGNTFIIIKGDETPFRMEQAGKTYEIFWFKTSVLNKLSVSNECTGGPPCIYHYMVANLAGNTGREPVLDPIIIIEP